MTPCPLVQRVGEVRQLLAELERKVAGLEAETKRLQTSGPTDA